MYRYFCGFYKNILSERLPVIVSFPFRILTIHTIITHAKHAVEWFQYNLYTTIICCIKHGDKWFQCKLISDFCMETATAYSRW